MKRKYRVEFHWADVQEAETWEEAIDEALEVFSSDYNFGCLSKAGVLATFRNSLKASVIEK